MTMPSIEQLTRLKELGAATVCEAQGSFGAFDNGIKPLDPEVLLAGPVVTVETRPADNLPIHFALETAKPGDVLVIDAKGYMEAGPWGDILTLQAMKMGLAGLIIDGCVRDASDVIKSGFPVFCRGISIKGTEKKAMGEINVPIMVGGVCVSPGDVIVGDRDGIVCVPKGTVASALEASEARKSREDEMRKAILSGATTAQLLGLSEKAK